MRITVRNWKNLGEVLKDPKFKDKPLRIEFYNEELFEITFETKKIRKSGGQSNGD